MRSCSLSRRTLVAALATACSTQSWRRTSRAEEIDAAALEDLLVQKLRADGGAAGTLLSPTDDDTVTSLVSQLERQGGSQLEPAEGIGSWGSWIGSWEIIYAEPSREGSPIVSSKVDTGRPLRLVSAREFVYGPPNAAEDLQGAASNGGASIECLFAQDGGSSAGTQLVVSRSGSFTKLSALSYRRDFGGAAVRVLPSSTGNAGANAASVATYALAAPIEPVGGIMLGEFTYLSERLWISKSEGGARTVLLRSDAAPLAPPTARPDLTATCSEAVFSQRAQVCRKTALL